VHREVVAGYLMSSALGREASAMTTPHQPADDFTGGELDEPLVEDLLDETRGPEEDHPTGGTEGADQLREEVADDLKPRD
jgi:hypothetical protein